jgi:valyl-tRNA synthetase
LKEEDIHTRLFYQKIFLGGPMEALNKVFIPEKVEEKWTSKWLDDCCFDKTTDKAKESFCILMPPPNVTGVLHMGHLLNQTLQDVFVRRARHCNKCATWIPGTDHAGISLQVKVEKELSKMLSILGKSDVKNF